MLWYFIIVPEQFIYAIEMCFDTLQASEHIKLYSKHNFRMVKSIMNVM